MSVFDRLKRRRAVTAEGSKTAGSVRVEWFQERVAESCPYLAYHGDEPIPGFEKVTT